jgi:hypothetical protein
MITSGGARLGGGAVDENPVGCWLDAHLLDTAAREAQLAKGSEQGKRASEAKSIIDKYWTILVH